MTAHSVVQPRPTTPAQGSLGLIYVLAASHSGSTLLAMLLGTHRDTCSVGELNAGNIGDPDRYRCSCGARIRECAFWQAVHDRMATRGTRFDITAAATDVRSGASAFERRLLRPLHRGPVLERLRDAALHLAPGWRRRLPEIRRRNRLLIQTVGELYDAQWVVDASKIGIRLKYLLRDPDLDVRVVHLVRDGRAVALTYRNPHEYADARDPQLRGGGAGTHRSHPVRTMRATAREWRRSNEEAQCILQGLDRSRWIEVRYEALCADVDGTLGRIFRHFQLDPDRRLENFRERCRHVIGNGMRFDASLEVRCDERWRDVLTAHDLEEFDAVAGALNRRYGYA
jgi:hypothetical protein